MIHTQNSFISLGFYYLELYEYDISLSHKHTRRVLVLLLILSSDRRYIGKRDATANQKKYIYIYAAYGFVQIC